MLYLKINDTTYPATFTGKMKDVEWDNRSSKTITLLDSTYEQANTLLVDDVKWAIYEPRTEKRQKIDPETGEPMYDHRIVVDDEGNIIYDEDGNVMYEDVPIMEDVDASVEYDNSAFSVRGDIIGHQDGTVSVKMGKLTDLEEAYELLYGGN